MTIGTWVRPIPRRIARRSIIRRCLVAPLSIIAFLPVLGLLSSNVPVACRVALASIVVVALAWPGAALLVLAGVAPLGIVLGSMAGMPYDLTEPLVLAFLSGWLARETIRAAAPLSESSRRVAIPAGLLAVVVAASSAVWLSALQPFVAYPQQFLRELISFLWSGYLLDRWRFPPLTHGLLILEGLGLFVAVLVMSESRPQWPRALSRMAVVGAAGVAALSLNRLIEVILRSGDASHAFWHYLVEVRTSAAFPDFNAAGSYFAMSAFLAMGLVVAAGRRWIRWIPAVVAIVTALWLTGSRAAMFAAPISGAAVLLMARATRVRLRTWRILAVAAVALALVALAATAHVAGTTSTRWTMRDALRARWTLGRAAAGMARQQPVFGVGIGRFVPVSAGYIDEDLRRIVPRENAHNNFLQILAELGLVGFVPFVWTLYAVGRRAWRTWSTAPVDPVVLGSGAGMLCFLLTCLFGHPLLIREVAFAFWLGLGGCAVLARGAWSESPAASRARQRGRWLTAAAVALIVCTLPVRARMALAEEDLGGAVLGLSSWVTDDTGPAFRWLTGSRAQFFVPADAGGARLSFRLVSPAPAAAVEISISVDGHLANRVHVVSGTWTDVTMVVPPPARFRFYRFEISVGEGAGPASGPPAHAFGRVQVAGPTLFTKRTPRQVAVPGDFTGDGRPDLLWRNTATGQNVIWNMSGATFRSQATLPTVADTNWDIAATADLNGDGQCDIVWRDATTGLNVVWYMRGTTFASQAELPPVRDPNWQIVAAADFNRDGWPDLVWRNRTTGQNQLWYMRGTTVIAQVPLAMVPGPDWRIVAAADFNGDDQPDLVWRNVTTGQNVVWYLNGATVLSQAALPTVADAAWQPAMAGDFNGDGRPDLVWRNAATGQNVVWYLEGVVLVGQDPLPTVADANWGILRPGR